MKIIYSNIFKKSLLKIDLEIQKRVIIKISFLEKISISKLYATNIDIKKLNPKDCWFYRIRVWKYRIIFTKYKDWIKLLDIDNRDAIYL